ncbi:MAG: tetratricopeptide repeat protein [Saprospiraceae bacterium]|nr:tetratricopeptide repeat protein [Saprospiraceae bacterium]
MSKINNKQWLALGAFLVLFLVLYFQCETKPPTQQAIEKSRALNAESTDINALLKEAKVGLESREANDILAAEAQLNDATSDSTRVEAFKGLASVWYAAGKPEISGYYAELVAEIEEQAEPWAIAGTTFSICLQQTQAEKIKSFCRDHAIQAFENAISINSSDTDSRINLALIYTEAPPADQPMKGILMLRELNEQFPENTSVLINLGRLGIQTGQFDKAIGRLEKAYELNPTDLRAACLLAEAYRGLGNEVESAKYASLCQQGTN